MNSTVRFMFATAGAVLLPLHPAFSAKVVQGAQQDNSLEGRISQLQQSIEERPNDPNLHFELSKLYEEDVENYYDEALSEFKDAVDNGLKGKTVIWNSLGDVNAHAGFIALQGGNYDKAIRNFEAAAKFNQNHYVMYNNIGYAYQQKKEYDKAIKNQRTAINLDPKRAASYEAIGMIYLENKDFRLSILNLNRFMYLDDSSENKKAFFNIAQGYHRLEEYSNAIDALDQLPRNLRRNDTVKAFRKECVGLLKQSN